MTENNDNGEQKKYREFALSAFALYQLVIREVCPYCLKALQWLDKLSSFNDNDLRSIEDKIVMTLKYLNQHRKKHQACQSKTLSDIVKNAPQIINKNMGLYLHKYFGIFNDEKDDPVVIEVCDLAYEFLIRHKIKD